jgi:hypothetical protein
MINGVDDPSLDQFTGDPLLKRDYRHSEITRRRRV